MKQSQLFTKTIRESPKDAVSVNAQLLERGGFVYKNSAGVYSFLPLGWRVLQKIAAIVKEEMNAIGAQEMFMPALVEKKYWETTGRWNVGIAFKVCDDEVLRQAQDERKFKFALGWTHEEVITEIVSHFINSPKDLPFAAYQIQTKFRNEARVKSGLLRGKEFIMKDLYSFHATQEDFESYYQKVKEAYEKIFRRLDLNALYVLAGGGDFTATHTHEFQVVSSVGEDIIAVCSGCGYAENKEISKLNDGDLCPKCEGKIKTENAIEVGNIFPLGNKYSQSFNLRTPVIMGSYGIGLSRAMGTIIETHHDEKGIIWPDSVAPFQVHLVEIGEGLAEKTYKDLQKQNIEVLYDDRRISAGEKLVDADLLGIPWRMVVSEKTGDKIEMKKRNKKESQLISLDDALKLFR